MATMSSQLDKIDVEQFTRSFLYDYYKNIAEMSRLTQGGINAVENRQSRHWAFTSWSDSPPKFDKDVMDYICYQQEETQEGKKHWQGYCMLPGYGQRLAVVKRMFGPGVHVEPKRIGTTKNQIREYTRKADSAVPDTWREFGNFDEPGAHSANPDSDYAQAVGMIMAGEKMSTVAERFPKTVAKNHAGFKALQFQFMLGGRPDDVPKTVKVFWGETRTGKTFAAKKYVDEHHPGSTYWLKTSKANLWFDGYERDSCIVIDDFEGQMTIDNFLHLTDRYAGRHTWQIKGGHTRLYHNTVIITSNSHPDNWFRDEHHNKRAAARARITSIEHFLHFPLLTPKSKAPPTVPPPVRLEDQLVFRDVPAPFNDAARTYVSRKLFEQLDEKEELAAAMEEEEAEHLHAMKDKFDQMAEETLDERDFMPVTPPPLTRQNAEVDIEWRGKPASISDRAAAPGGVGCKGTEQCPCYGCQLTRGKESVLDGTMTVADVLRRLREEDPTMEEDWGRAPFTRR